MAAFNPVPHHYPSMESSQLNEQRNYEFNHQHSEATKNPNNLNQFYSSSHLNVNNFHYPNHYPYGSSSTNYLGNSAPQTTASLSQCLSQALNAEQFGIANNMDSSAYGNHPHHNHIGPPAIEDVTIPTSVSNLLAQNSPMESNENQLQRISPGHYYSSLQQQQVANPSAMYQHQSGQPLGDYYHFGTGSQQCENYQPQQQFAAVSSASANNHSFTTPLYAANFNLDYASLQQQMFDGGSYEPQPGSHANQNGSLSTPNIAVEMASRPSPDRCYVATSLAPRQGSLAGDFQANDNSELSALKNAAKNADHPSQLFPAPSSMSTAGGSAEDNKRRMKQQLISIAQTNKQKVGAKIQHSASSASISSGSLGMISRRKNATRETTSTLKDWLDEHGQNPYPTKGEKIMLSIITKMSLTQVSTWFANARRRMKKESKVFWNGSQNGGNLNRVSSGSAQTASMGASNGANCSFLNKNGASSIRYFIHKHRKQLAGAGSMLALSGESRYAPIVYCGQSSSMAPAPVKTAAEDRQQHSGIDNDSNRVNGDNKRGASKPAAQQNGSSLSQPSPSISKPASSAEMSSSSSQNSASSAQGKANKS